MLERYRCRLPDMDRNRQATFNTCIDLKGGHVSRTETREKCNSESMMYDRINKKSGYLLIRFLNPLAEVETQGDD